MLLQTVVGDNQGHGIQVNTALTSPDTPPHELQQLPQAYICLAKNTRIANNHGFGIAVCRDGAALPPPRASGSKRKGGAKSGGGKGAGGGELPAHALETIFGGVHVMVGANSVFDGERLCVCACVCLCSRAVYVCVCECVCVRTRACDGGREWRI